jgi:hypothetical protein
MLRVELKIIASSASASRSVGKFVSSFKLECKTTMKDKSEVAGDLF